MKYMILVLGALLCLQADAQTQKKSTKKSSKKRYQTVSRSGIKVDTTGSYEVSKDTAKNDGIKNINANYNETTPGLSPSSGTDAPILK